MKLRSTLQAYSALLQITTGFGNHLIFLVVQSVTVQSTLNVIHGNKADFDFVQLLIIGQSNCFKSLCSRFKSNNFFIIQKKLLTACVIIIFCTVVLSFGSMALYRGGSILKKQTRLKIGYKFLRYKTITSFNLHSGFQKSPLPKSTNI